VKLRHVRAVAVFGVAVVALTGARHSHGGGCSGGSSSHSSSSSGGTSGSSSHYHDDDDDYSGSSSTGTTGSTTGSTTGNSTGATTGSGKVTRPVDDVKIETCVFDESRGIVAHVRATNSSARTAYTYKFGVTFRDPAGNTVRTSSATIPLVYSNSNDTLDVVASYVLKDGEDGSDTVCVLKDVTRTAE
jgi:hypothetical protein